VPSERCSIEEQSTEYCVWACESSDVVCGDLRTRLRLKDRRNAL
jgi:hypothetical protein